MNIEWRGLDPIARIEAAVGRGSTGVENLRIVIVQDFVAHVREVLNSTTYGSDRGNSGVVAKTLPKSKDPHIAVNASLFVDLDQIVQERIIRHECGHVLAWRRGEGEASLDPSSDANVVKRRIWLRSLELVDEYRAELYAVQKGCPPSPEVTLEHLEDFLDYFEDELEPILQDARQYEGFLDPRKAGPLIDTAEHTLAILSAQKEASLDSLPNRAAEIWHKHFKRTWTKLIDALDPVADSSSSYEGLRKTVMEVSEILVFMLEQWGFSLVEVDTDQGPQVAIKQN